MTIKTETDSNTVIEFDVSEKGIGIFAYDEFYELSFGGFIDFSEWKQISKTISQVANKLEDEIVTRRLEKAILSRAKSTEIKEPKHGDE